MLAYVVRRIAHAAGVLIIVSVFVLVLTHLIPGGEARAVLGARATPQTIAQFNRVNGLNLPIWDQYWHLVKGYASGHFGYSYQYNEPVGTLIANRLPKTLLLVGLAIFVALIASVPIGVYQAQRRNRPGDYVVTTVSFAMYSMPTFFLGPVLILYFAIHLHWLSYEAPQGQTVLAVLSDPRGLVLPVLTLALVSLAAFSRFIRSSLLDELTEDYVRTARGKGASERRVLYRHGLRNALLPVVTMLGLALPNIVGGAFIVESVFNYPGMGLLGVNAIVDDDIPTLMGTVVVAAIATVVGSLMADLLYGVLDPRIRFTER